MFIELGLVLTCVLGFALIYLLRNLESVNNSNTDNILINDNVLDFNSLTLRQKLAQMFIVNGIIAPKSIVRLNVGVIYFNVKKLKEDYKRAINEYTEKSKILLFIATDLEGYWNPFIRFYKSKYVSGIADNKEAFELGKEHGEILNEIGFNMNFAPVVEIEDKIWKDRAFKGNVLEIGGKIDSYIEGLQSQKILGCAKHFPGGSLNVKDPHKNIVEAEISERDLDLFESAIKSRVSSIMIGNVVVKGQIDSQGKPCAVNEECIKKLRKRFKGLIVTDEVNMEGLRDFYRDKIKMYTDLINAGNDLIIDFRLTVSALDRTLRKLEKMVKSGEINVKRIDESVKRILKYKKIRLR